jgi:hypothetical protein
MLPVSAHRACVMNRVAGLQLAIGEALDDSDRGGPPSRMAALLALLLVDLYAELIGQHLLPAIGRVSAGPSVLRWLDPVHADVVLLRGLVVEHGHCGSSHERAVVLVMLRGQLQEHDRNLHALFDCSSVGRADWQQLLLDIDSALSQRRRQLAVGVVDRDGGRIGPPSARAHR